MPIVRRGEHPEWLLGVVPALSMVDGLVAPGAVYFTSPDDCICWLRVTNAGAAAMEIDSADELFTGQVLTSGGEFKYQKFWYSVPRMLPLFFWSNPLPGK